MPQDINKLNSDLDSLIKKLEQVTTAIKEVESGTKNSTLSSWLESVNTLLKQLQSGNLKDLATLLEQIQGIGANIGTAGTGNLEKFAAQLDQISKSIEVLVNSYKELNNVQAQPLENLTPQTEKSAQGFDKLTQSMEAAKKALMEVLRIAATGGTPTEAGLGRAAEKILGENVPASGRIRVGGNARTSLKSIQSDIDTTVAKYNELKKVQEDALNAPPPVKRPSILGTAEEQEAGLKAAEEARRKQKEIDDKAILDEAETIKKREALNKQFAQLRAKLGPGVGQAIEKEARSINRAFDSIRVSAPKELGDGFERFTVTLTNASQPVKQFTLYVNELGEAMNQLAYNQAKAQKTQFTPQGIEAALGQFRAQRATGVAQLHGFTIEDLQKIRTQEPTGVSMLSYRNIDQATGAYKELEVTVDRVGNVLTRTNKRLLSFGDAIIRNTAEVLRWSIGVGLVYGSIYKLQSLVSTAIDNEAKLADITVVLGDSQKNVNEIFDAANKVARETGSSINDVLESYVSAYRAVGSIADPLKKTAAATQLLTNATILDKLSSLDAAEAIDVLSGSLRQMQQPGEDATQVFERGRDLLDKWVATTRVANVDLATLATAFSVTSESALNAGVSVDQLNGIIASLSEKIGGLGGKETGNAVRALIGGIYQTQAAGALNKYGIAVTDATGKMRPFLDISREIYNLYQGGLIDTTQLNQLGYVLGGGVRRGQQYVAFLSDLDKVQQFAAASADSQGTAEAALAKKLDVTQTSITNLGNAFQNLAQTLGTSGGILDLTNGLLKTFTSLVDQVTQLSKILGRLAVPAALLAITKYAFSGPVGANRQTLLTSSLGGGAQNLVSGIIASIFPGLNQSYRNPFGRETPSFATRAGQAANGAVSQYGLSFLLGAYPAASRFGQGQTGAGIADTAGALAGAIISKGNLIGGVIGSAIAEFFLSKTIDYKPQFQNLFKDIFPKPAETTTTPTGTTQDQLQQDLFKELYTQIGYGLDENLGKFRANMFTELYNIASNVRKKVTGEGFGQLTPEQAALLQATPEQQARIRELRQNQPVTTEEVNISASKLGQAQTELGKQYRDYLDQLTRSTQDTLRQQLFGGQINANTYLQGIQSTQGLPSTVTKYFEAFGNEFKKLNPQIKDDRQAFDEFAKTISNGTEENITYITQLATEIFDLSAKIEEADKQGRSFVEDINGQSITTTTAAEIVANDARDAAAALKAMRQQQIINATQLPNVIDLSAYQKDFRTIISRATQLEDAYKEALTPDERTKYEAERALETSLIEVWATANQQAYERMKGGPAENFITQAFQDLVKQGTVEQAGQNQNIGFTSLDVTQQQFKALDTQYTSLLNRLVAKGYTPDRQTQIAIYKDGIIEPLTKDWKVVQYLLQQILDVNQKQLDGVYNLPAESSFYVPFQTLALAQAAGANGAGGGGGAFGAALAQTTPKVTEFGQAIAEAIAKLNGMNYGTINQTPSASDVYRQTVLQRQSAEGFLGEPLTKTIEKSINKWRIPYQLPQGEQPGGITPWKTDPFSGLSSKSLINPSDLSQAFASAITPDKLSTKLGIDITSSTSLVVDGAVLAQIVKKYIWADLIRYEGTGGSVSTTVAL